MASTPKGLTYPIATDPPQGYSQIQTLATNVDSQFDTRDALLGVTSAKSDGSGTVVRSGSSVITAEETSTNTAYGLMTTPDRVQNVVLPTAGLLMVGYVAVWKCSVASAASAALFLNSTQVVINSSGATPLAVDTIHQSGTASRYAVLATTSMGLSTTSSGGSVSGSVATTGQVLSTNQPALAGANFDGGGVTYIWADAGTYTVSVQFKASSGSVSAKERRLWVRALSF